MSGDKSQTTEGQIEAHLNETLEIEMDAFKLGIKEGFRRVLESSGTMTREMLIQWLKAETNAD